MSHAQQPHQRVASWNEIWDGGGTIAPSGNGACVLLSPAVAKTSRTTHSALLASVPAFGDIELSVRLRTTRRLRINTPANPWEVGWVVWHFTDRHHFYYVILKPNGWELGKADPAYPGAQRFLATGSDRAFPIGSWYQVDITQKGPLITVRVDGYLLTTFVDRERPYRHGSIGLYCEDAAVEFAAPTASGRL